MSQGVSEAVQQQAEVVFRRIERRITHILDKLHLAAVMILEQDDTPPETPGAADLEYTAPHWQELVPESPDIRAILLYMFIENYPINESSVVKSLTNLGWDDPAVRTAFERFYGQPVPTHSVDDKGADQVVNRFYGLEWMYLKRGETLFNRGDPGDRIYILLEGLLRTTEGGKSDRYSSSSNRLVPGALIGGQSWLTNEPYEATVVALRDSDIVYMTRESFETYVQRHPAVLRKLAAGVVRQLREVTHPEPIAPTSRSIVILPATAGLDGFPQQLKNELTRFGTVKLLTADLVSEATNHHADLEMAVDAYDFVDWLEQQEARHDYPVYVGDGAYPKWTRRCIEQADRILIVARSTESPDISPVEIILRDIPHPELIPPVDLVLVHERRSTNPTRTAEWLNLRTMNHYHHVALDHPPDFERLVRHLRGRAVGIVFGGGGMRGLAHVGVIKALHDRGIHCDLAGGTSAGAIIAACYGLGWDTDAILTGAIEAMDRKTMFEPTIPLTSILTGNKLNATYRKMFGVWQIEDLWTPIFTIASNLTQAAMTIKETGSLQKAVRASTSLAGILPPTIDDNGDLLLDGGAFDNTPADVMRERIGSGTVIAVDLGYTQREFPQYTYDDRVNGFAVLWSQINPFMKTMQVPAIMDIMMRSNGLGGMSATASQVAQADLIIRPPVTQYGLYDSEAASDIFEAGYRHGEQIIADWIDSGGLRDTYDRQ